MTGVKKSGFTLVELLVTTAIFLSLVMSITTIFLLTRRSERSTLTEQTLTNQLRFVSQTVSQEISQHKIAYDDWLPLTPGPISEIHLTDMTGNDLEIIDLDQGRVKISRDGGQSWADLTTAQIVIDKFDLYIQPRLDFNVIQAGQYLSDRQPLVTLVIKGHLADDPVAKDLLIQTTVSSRAYQR